MTKLSLVQDKEGGLPTTTVEVFAGSAVAIQELVRYGFAGRAYECAPEGKKGEYLPEGDVERPENQQEIAAQLKEGKVCKAGTHKAGAGQGQGSSGLLRAWQSRRMSNIYLFI